MSALPLCLLLSVGYVAPFYIWHSEKDRNHPATIRSRFACTLGYCCIAWIPVLHTFKAQDAGAVLDKLGLKLDRLLPAAVLPLLLTASLFLGPLVLCFTGPRSSKEQRRYCDPVWLDLAAWRDIVMAPVTEEFVFRILLLAVLKEKGYSDAQAVLLCPLFFGVAHLHHLYEYVHHRGFQLKQAIPVVAFQFLYTTAFGWYAAWLVVRTRHFIAPVISHSFCNVVGVPNILAISQHRAPKIIVILFAIGILAFVLLLRPMTSPALY